VLLAAGGGGGGVGLTDLGGGAGGGGNELGTGPQTCYQVCTINLYPSSTSQSCYGFGCHVTSYTVTNTLLPGGLQVYSYWQYGNSWWYRRGWYEVGGWWVMVNGKWVEISNSSGSYVGGGWDYYDGEQFSIYQSLVNICGYYGQGIFQGYNRLPFLTTSLPSISGACAQSCSQVCGIWGTPPTYHFMQGENAVPICPDGDGGGGGGYYGGPAGIPGGGGSGYCSPIVQNCGGITGGANNGDQQTNATIRGGNGKVIISW
jgi:hypothetical protein